MSGEPREYVRTSDEGERRVFSFCPECGVTVWFASVSDPDLVAVPVGVFADPDFPAPQASAPAASGSSHSMIPWIVFVTGAALILAAWTASLRARPLRRRA